MGYPEAEKRHQHKSTIKSSGKQTYGEYVSIESVEVDEEVNTGICQGTHASGMVRIGVNVVDADGVGAELCHQRGIESTLVAISQGIGISQLVSNALDVELGAILVEELVAIS